MSRIYPSCKVKYKIMILQRNFSLFCCTNSYKSLKNSQQQLLDVIWLGIYFIWAFSVLILLIFHISQQLLTSKMNSQLTLDQVAINSLLAKKGWLAKDLLQSYKNRFSINLLQNIKNILNCPLTSQKSRQMKVVSLDLQALLPCCDPENLEYLCSSRRTFITKGLWRILVPDGRDRFNIESIREKTVTKIRNELQIDEEEKKVLSELYFLLSLGSNELLELFEDPNGDENQVKIKKCLTSLKKMMGNEVEMEEQDKKLKKKAYNQNLEIRKVLQAISSIIREDNLSYKVDKMLEAPKNKKWFGTRLNKLMSNENWSEEEMRIFMGYISIALKEKEINGVKLNKSKKILKEIHSNIIKYLNQQDEGMPLQTQNDPESKKEETDHAEERNHSEGLVQVTPDSFYGRNIRYSLFDSLLLEENNDLN